MRIHADRDTGPHHRITERACSRKREGVANRRYQCRRDPQLENIHARRQRRSLEPTALIGIAFEDGGAPLFNRYLEVRGNVYHPDRRSRGDIGRPGQRCGQ